MTNQLATPLRAEPDLHVPGGYRNDSWLLLSNTGEVLARGLTKETAATLVAMSEDAKRLDWLEARAYMVYRDRDPESGRLCDHATVVNEDEPGGRRGILGPTLRQAIDKAALAAGGEKNG